MYRNTARNRRTMSARLVASAKRNHKRLVKCGDFDERALRRMIDKDLRDLLKLATLIRNNRTTAALNLYYKLDTALIDEVPRSVGDFIFDCDEQKNPGWSNVQM